MLIYLLEASCCSILFYLVYILFFKSHTNHNFNRFYLLSSIFLSFLIPWLEIVTKIEPLITETTRTSTILGQSNTENSIFSLSNLLPTLYLIGVLISMTYFLSQLIKLFSIINNGEKLIIKNQHVVAVKEKIDVCSFFRNIIIPISQKDKISQFEIRHEKAHISQLHSLDIVIAWLFQSVLWFNPITYFYKNRLMEVHEFLADKNVIMHMGKSTYQDYILNIVSHKLQPHLAHNFNSIIKTRLTMMNSNSNPSKWSYGVAIAVFSFTLFLFSCKTKSVQYTSHLDPPESEWLVKTVDVNDPRTQWLTETIIDTTVVIDYDTYEERISINKKEYQYTLDTIIVFHPETYEETVSIVKTYKGTPPGFKEK